jgi:creatinine amidohydrolase
VPELRTRFYDSLRNREIESYLARRDVIFLPVGTMEMHGEMPVGCEHVLPLAVAFGMAEAADGLVLPGLHYFYPGATAIGRGTVQITPTAGAAYLRAICGSLLRQGFRRQVLLSAHGPAEVTIAPMVREFFDETKCSILYVDLEPFIGAYAWEEFNKMLWGAYDILGRLEEIPRDQQPMTRTFPKQIITGRFHFGAYYANASDHGWGPDHALSDAERRARAQEGREMIGKLIREIDPAALVEKMRELDDYLKRDVLPRYRDHLP